MCHVKARRHGRTSALIASKTHPSLLRYLSNTVVTRILQGITLEIWPGAQINAVRHPLAIVNHLKGNGLFWLKRPFLALSGGQKCPSLHRRTREPRGLGRLEGAWGDVRMAKPQDQITKLMAIAANGGAQDAAEPRDDASREASAYQSTPPPLARKVAEAQSADVETEFSPRRVARRRPAGPVRSKIAANDDVPSIGGLIYALEQKPSSKSFRIAAIASLMWAVAGIAFAAFSLAPEWVEGASIGSLLLKPVTYYTISAIVVPVAIMWLLAVLNWHVASLALKSSTMTEVAIRLAEPDRSAEQSIASLGQAVRRQVSFMNDAVSRALGRAGELEALVHNQVADLERSYEQNERRIRGLIQELTGERHALLNTSTSVTDTLKTLGTEIPTLIEKLSTQQVTLAGIIKGAGENLSSLEHSLATQTDRFEISLGSRTQQLQTVLEDYTSAFSTALGSRTEQMRVSFDSYMQTLDTSLGNRTENLQTVFEEYAKALDTTLSNRAQALDIQLVERTKSLDDAFQRRLELFDDQIVKSTTAIDTAVSEKAALLTTALDTHASTFRESIARQAVELDESVMNGINAVRRTSENITRQSLKAIEGLANQSDMLRNVSENLLGQIHGVTDRFENQGHAILKAANALESANYKIDTTLQARHQDISHTLERFSGKADEIGRVFDDYSSNLEGSLTTIESRTRALTQELQTGTESRTRALLAELDRAKNQVESESGRTFDDMKNRFSSVSGELSKEFESLTGRLSSASDEARLRGAEAASTLALEQERIREEAARLPEATRETAEAMRRALQDQLKALDQLTQISSRTAAQRDVMPPDAAPVPALRNNTPPPAIQQPEPARSRTAPQRPATVETREGWSLGDLLARASHETSDDDAHVQATSAPFRLDVASIARSIDPATASAIWNRFRAGQRNIMVRSIYAPEIRIVFDEVSRRIKSDRDLTQTVQRYLADFEGIVREADGRDPTGRLAHTHLVSDTGRVYLFLAHAAGRAI